jgi:hypothetical protein
MGAKKEGDKYNTRDIEKEEINYFAIQLRRVMCS